MIAGGTPDGLPTLERTLAELVTRSFPSGFSLAVVDAGGTLVSAYGGEACRIGTARPITTRTSYDLASLTKVVCSVTLALVYAGRGMLTLDDPVVDWLPGFSRSDTTLLHLLTHTSGLVAHRPFFERLRGRAAIVEAVFEEAAGSAPTGEVLYSDLNFMLLGWVLEACGGAGLGELFATEVALPLGMNRTGFLPAQGEETAATELDGDQRLVPGLVWGEVHDGNAYALGGVAGHAGLFAPVADLAVFVQTSARSRRPCAGPAGAAGDVGAAGPAAARTFAASGGVSIPRTGATGRTTPCGTRASPEHRCCSRSPVVSASSSSRTRSIRTGASRTRQPCERLCTEP